MRKYELENAEYIVNLTTQLLGKYALDDLKLKFLNNACKPRIFFDLLGGIIRGKIVKMNDETLGRICSYASAEGAHWKMYCPGEKTPKFINCTGLNDVLGDSVGVTFRQQLIGQYLETIAIATIVCIAFDIVFQSKWQKNWEISDKEREHLEHLWNEH
jgi:hypothetical protein